MDAMTRDMFATWARSPRYLELVKSTRASITRYISGLKGPEVNVSVSGGKDSLVMLDLVLGACPGASVWHWDYGIYMPRAIEAEVLAILRDHFELGPPRLVVDRRESKDPRSVAGYRAFFAAITGHLKATGALLNFIGLRREESCRRSNRAKEELEPCKPCPNAFPLAAWTWKDIWAYLVSRGIPYPSSYDAKGPVEGWDTARFVTFFDPEFAHLGSIERDKFLFWKTR
nr:phosphoadenosine phosphosulfate reductase family protein [Candidatus Sigynarchaeum springense]